MNWDSCSLCFISMAVCVCVFVFFSSVCISAHTHIDIHMYYNYFVILINFHMYFFSLTLSLPLFSFTEYVWNTMLMKTHLKKDCNSTSLRIRDQVSIAMASGKCQSLIILYLIQVDYFRK